MENMTVLLVSEDPVLRGMIINALEATKHLQLQEVITDAASLEDAAWKLTPDLIVATLGEDPESILKALAALGERCPEAVLCGPAERSDLIIRSMQIGVREYVPLPMEPDELISVMERLSSARGPRENQSRGNIISILGAKGGVGTTTIACQIASCLQALGARTVIIDLNLVSGDVALYHDVSPTFGVADLERESGEIDTTYLQSLIEIHASGVGLMASPLHVHAEPSVRPARLQQALQLMQEFNDFVLIDLPGDRGDLGVASLEVTDQVLVVTSLDVPSLAHCKLQLRRVDQSGVPRSATLVVANNSFPDSSLSGKDIRGFLGRPVDFEIPSDVSTVMEAINKGTGVSSISPRSDIAMAIESMARDLGKRSGWESEREGTPNRAMSKVRKLILGVRYGAS